LIGQPPWTALGSRERAERAITWDGLVLLIVLLIVLVTPPHFVL
jgi:hypothetical protein